MWMQDGPDMLYCDGLSIYRLKPTIDIFWVDSSPIEIVKERELGLDEGPVPNDWPFKYVRPA